MSNSSDKLKGYEGGNPFRESQAREYPGRKVVQEFFPTNTFRSLFNEQNEILIGTRGSGKTILLRMLSYTNLREVKDDSSIQEIVRNKQFLGFYVPLHLELIRRITTDPAHSIQYFSFSLNCSAAEALLTEVKSLLIDCIPDKYDRRFTEAKILKALSEAWAVSTEIPQTIEDFQWLLNTYYSHTKQWEDKAEEEIPILARSVLMPIRSALKRITQLLGLDDNNTQWIACIDEAEFLPEPYIKALNTFMRSEKRPLTIKLATLPFEHSTRETLETNIKIESNGNDFNYRKIDYDPDSDEFKKLTDHVTKIRLLRCQITVDSLEDFLGVVGKDEGFDYYKLEVGETETSQDAIFRKIRDSLPEKRHARFDRNREIPYVMNQQYLKKFSPVLYVREMKKEDRKGNRVVGWFAGSKMVRRIADGNSRRFLQLMNDLVQGAIEKELTPKNQHRILVAFAQRANRTILGLPQHGLLAKELIDSIGTMLEERTHDGHLVEAGCDFRIDHSLIGISKVMSAIKAAVAYSHIVTPEDVFESITEETLLRLSYLNAVCHWLPMRKGDPAPRLKGKLKPESEKALEAEISKENQSVAITHNFQLSLDLMEPHETD